MHDQLARIYHLARRVLAAPFWHPPVAAFIVALLLRLLGPARAGLAAALAILAGWLALTLPLNPFTAAGPVARLPGAALLLAAFAHYGGGKKLPGWLALALYATAAAWWLRGAPLGGPAIANLVPVIIGLITAAAVARRLAAADQGAATIAAAAALAAGLQFAGASPHWARAALVPAAAGFALLGLPGAIAPLAQALILVATAAIAASNRGRLIPVDIAAATPFLVWFITPRLRPRLTQAGPALAAGLAAVACVAIVWGAMLLTR